MRSVVKPQSGHMTQCERVLKLSQTHSEAKGDLENWCVLQGTMRQEEKRNHKGIVLSLLLRRSIINRNWMDLHFFFWGGGGSH